MLLSGIRWYNIVCNDDYECMLFNSILKWMIKNGSMNCLVFIEWIWINRWFVLCIAGKRLVIRAIYFANWIGQVPNYIIFLVAVLCVISYRYTIAKDIENY